MLNELTLEDLKKMNPCIIYSMNDFRYAKWLFANRESLSFIDINNLAIRIADKLWILIRMMSNKELFILCSRLIDEILPHLSHIFDNSNDKLEYYQIYSFFLIQLKLLNINIKLYLKDEFSLKDLSNFASKLYYFSFESDINSCFYALPLENHISAIRYLCSLIVNYCNSRSHWTVDANILMGTNLQLGNSVINRSWYLTNILDIIKGR